MDPGLLDEQQNQVHKRLRESCCESMKSTTEVAKNNHRRRAIPGRDEEFNGGIPPESAVAYFLKYRLSYSKDVMTMLGNVLTTMCLDVCSLLQFETYNPSN
ncbi:unnamed protein product [Caenorhabditis sp. 36 PRJEB53466]|nr:unnamed protein product [Caenorhabditis sp. 36 PRJEB53466]